MLKLVIIGYRTASPIFLQPHPYILQGGKTDVYLRPGEMPVQLDREPLTTW